MYSAVGAAGRRLHVTQAQLRFATCRVAAVPLTRWLAGKPGQAVLNTARSEHTAVLRRLAARPLKPLDTAPTAPAPGAALDHLNNQCGTRYPMLIDLWRSSWNWSVPSLDYDTETRQ